VVPDIVLPTAAITSEQGEDALDNALPWDEIKPARFVKADAPVARFQIARELHEKRLESDVLFQLLLAEMKLVHKTSQRKTTSLLESRRKLEREQLLTARKKLQNESRKAQRLEPLEETASEEEYNETEPLDVILREAARILADLINPVTPVSNPVTAKRIRKIPLQ